jgi:hypothetical protein
MWAEGMTLRKTPGFLRGIDPCPVHECCTNRYPFLVVFPASKPQQSRGLMVRAGNNEKHLANKD